MVFEIITELVLFCLIVGQSDAVHMVNCAVFSNQVFYLKNSVPCFSLDNLETSSTGVYPVDLSCNFFCTF